MKRSGGIEATLAAAFARAEKSRRAAGMSPRSIVATSRPRAGGNWIGPTSYRITLWLRPWEYLEVLETMRHERFNGSITKYLSRPFQSTAPIKQSKPKGAKNTRASSQRPPHKLRSIM